MYRRFQFGMRENPASDQRHGSRLTGNHPAPQEYVSKENQAPRPRSTSGGHRTASTAEAARISSTYAATGREKRDASGPPNSSGTFVQLRQNASTLSEACPLTVREAAKYLGVSPQSVYLWVERKQIPHLRVMGRNIRFLKSELETFRASFKQEMENA